MDNFENVKYGPVKPGYDYLLKYHGPFDHDIERVPSTVLPNSREIEMIPNK